MISGHHPPHQRPHKLGEHLIPQHPPKHRLPLNPISKGGPIRVPHERVDRRDEVWLRGARGDGARLVGGGVDQDPAQEPGEFVTEGVGAIFPHSAHNCHPLISLAAPSSARIARLTQLVVKMADTMTVGWWVSLGQVGDVRGDVCVEREGGEGGCEVGCGGLSNWI